MPCERCEAAIKACEAYFIVKCAECNGTGHDRLYPDRECYFCKGTGNKDLNDGMTHLYHYMFEAPRAEVARQILGILRPEATPNVAAATPDVASQ